LCVKKEIDVIWCVVMLTIYCVKYWLKKIKASKQFPPPPPPKSLWFSIGLSFCWYNILETFLEVWKMVHNLLV